MIVKLGGYCFALFRTTLSDSQASIPSTLRAVERAHILRTLEHTGWVISGEKGTATILGLHPSTLQSRMQKLGIKRARSMAA